MTIRISRNSAGNCLNFIGSSLPAYFNACLSGSVDAETGTVNVINDIQTANNPNGEVRYEFYQIPYTEFADKDGNDFADAQACADYITEQGHVLGVSDTGTDLTGVAVNFRLDDTNTSIIMDNGSAFGVNTIKAVADADGTIHIHAIGAGSPNSANAANDHKHFEKLEVSNVSVGGAAVSGGLNDVVNVLNELFTVGPFESVVISDPYSTMVADVSGELAGYTLEGTDAIDPVGDDIFTYDGSGYANYAGLKSTATIDQNGEYYTFDIRGEGAIGFGLVHSDASFAAGHHQGNANYADPDNFAAINSAHYGMQFSHWFHPTPNGSWTNYGALTGYVGGTGWNNWDQQADWLAGNPVKIKCGIDENGYIAISSLQDDGTWVLHARSNYPVPQGSEFHLGIKSQATSARVYSAPKVHLLEPAAPVMQFRYIESPDGTYNWPLFATAAEAEYYDEIHNGLSEGTGSSHTHQYADDPTATTWYMPEATHDPTTYAHSSAPSGETFSGNAVAYTEITSLVNADLAPDAYTDNTVNVNEGTAVNIAITPADADYTTTVDFGTSGLTLVGNNIEGTAPAVAGDNVTNPSDDYVVTVTRTNTYGTSTGYLTVRVMNLTAPTVDTGDWTSSTGTLSAGVLQQDSSANLDITLSEGERLIVPKGWVDAHVSPNNLDVDEKVYFGTLRSDATTSTIEIGDFAGCFRFAGRAATTSHEVRLNDQLGSSVGNQTFIQTGASTYDYAIELYNGSLYLIACNLNSINTQPAVAEGGTFSRTLNCGTISDNSLSSPLTVTLGTGTGAVVDLDDSLTSDEVTKITIPAASTNLTAWTKALDFSGSSERAQMVTNNSNYMPIAMGGISSTVALPSTSGNTAETTYSRPWATACVFKIDGHNSNQHIWNQGEGSSSTNDNIYMRLSASRDLFFGWGRGNEVNECYLGRLTDTSLWWGVSVAHTGARLSASDATAANLAQCFDIRLTSSFSANEFAIIGSNKSTQTNWQSGSTGSRMDRSVNGYLTVGGRGANRNFHGKVASFVVTTLRLNQVMPSSDEHHRMITDPIKWLNDDKVGNQYRYAPYITNGASFALQNTSSQTTWNELSTQVWLMGDGAMDSYSNMIRNVVNPQDQNYTKLNLLSMVSNDIQNVTINGLS